MTGTFEEFSDTEEVEKYVGWLVGGAEEHVLCLKGLRWGYMIPFQRHGRASAADSPRGTALRPATRAAWLHAGLHKWSYATHVPRQGVRTPPTP